MIAVQRIEDGYVSFDDLSHHISQSPQKWLTWNRKPLIEIAGKEATVYIIDTFDEFTHEQHVKIASMFIQGLYEVYSLVTGEVTHGDRKI